MIFNRGLLSILVLASFCGAVEFPLDLYGRAHFGKYLNSDTSLYYLDVSTDFYCTVMRHRSASVFIRYRDDLDVAGSPQNGVLFDPRRLHYYFVLGTEYRCAPALFTLYFMHDCVHLIDVESGIKPIFNRLKLSAGAPDFQVSREMRTTQKILWQLTVGWYPGWQYHSWSINSGADYKWDAFGDLRVGLIKGTNYAVRFLTTLGAAIADSSNYYQTTVGAECCYLSARGNAAGLNLTYTLYNNDPIKSTDKLWLLSAFFQF
ncbi:MAG TPA: hypothetical protein VF399_12920 [bacterium]